MPTSLSRARQLTYSLITAILVITVPLGVVEATLRVIYRDGGHTTLGAPGGQEFEHELIDRATERRTPPPSNPKSKGAQRIVVFGDSITWGYGIHHWRDTYPNQPGQWQTVKLQLDLDDPLTTDVEWHVTVPRACISRSTQSLFPSRTSTSRCSISKTGSTRSTRMPACSTPIPTSARMSRSPRRSVSGSCQSEAARRLMFSLHRASLTAVDISQ